MRAAFWVSGRKDCGRRGGTRRYRWSVCVGGQAAIGGRPCPPRALRDHIRCSDTEPRGSPPNHGHSFLLSIGISATRQWKCFAECCLICAVSPVGTTHAHHTDTHTHTHTHTHTSGVDHALTSQRRSVTVTWSDNSDTFLLRLNTAHVLRLNKADVLAIKDSLLGSRWLVSRTGLRQGLTQASMST